MQDRLRREMALDGSDAAHHIHLRRFAAVDVRYDVVHTFADLEQKVLA